MAAGMMAAPALARRIRPATLVAGGLAVAAAGMLAQTATGTAGGVVPVVVGLTLAGVGISPAMALTINLVLGSTPPENAGSAASISETSGEFGIALGVATLGSLATVVYRADITVPAGVPAAAGDAARQGITAAAQAAQRLPGPLGADLLDAARDAFTAGLTTVAGVGAAVFVGLAVLAARTFRHVGGSPAADAVPAAPADVDADEAPRELVAATAH
jgi:DHA2 family multidrug resistance protein-like MFS transporter